MEIAGRSAILRGGASGLGPGTARLLAGRGAKVVVADLNVTAAREIAAETDGVAVAAAVTSSDSLAAAISAAEFEAGGVRILISCAGFGTPTKLIGR